MKKQQKFLLVLPLIVIPFLTLAFIALGGGKTPTKTVAAKGIDTALPVAQFKDEKPQNKMAVYQQAKKDTANGISPEFRRMMRPDTQAEASTQKIQAKLAVINQQISQPQPVQPADPEAQHLNKMMKAMNRPQKDPEMAQLNNMLSKIQAIQHPELVKKPKKKADADSAFKAIPATVDGKQKVVNGGTVRLKLTDSVKIKGVQLPAGQLLFGSCQVTNQRLLLTIQNIRIGKDILPTNLTVFSLDGMPGIPAPEAEISSAAGDGANSAVENMQFLSMDQSIGAQAAAGGVNAAKGLFSKKVKTIKVKLKDQFPVLLKINK